MWITPINVIADPTNWKRDYSDMPADCLTRLTLNPEYISQCKSRECHGVFQLSSILSLRSLVTVFHYSPNLVLTCSFIVFYIRWWVQQSTWDFICPSGCSTQQYITPTMTPLADKFTEGWTLIVCNITKKGGCVLGSTSMYTNHHKDRPLCNGRIHGSDVTVRG